MAILAHHLRELEFDDRNGRSEEDQAGEVFGVDDADDVLGAAGLVVDRHAGAHMFDDLGAGRFDRQVRGQRKDLLPRGHDLADGHILQFQGAMDERLLKPGQNAHAPGGCGDELELVGRVDLGALGERNIEAAQNDGRRVLEQPHRGAGHGHEDEHGRGDGYG